MRQTIAGVGALISMAAGLVGPSQPPPARKGVTLAELTWSEAEPWLTPSMVVVLPLGAGALEQGPHMKLDSDERLARYLSARVQAATAVVVAPPLNYHFYPAYATYPGSTSLSDASARDLTVDAIRGLARYGPRRFYVLNTSPSTLGPLSAAAQKLSDAGILLGYTDPDYWTRATGILKQTPIAGGHAEEAATSMMLFVDPGSVDMTRAKREYPAGRGAPSKSGTFGDATLATAEKGRTLVDALAAGILEDIEKVRNAPLPDARTSAPAPTQSAPPPRPAAAGPPRAPGGCTAGDDRAIRNVGAQFSSVWAQADAERLAAMFTPAGDIRHPDGSIERGRNVILANRLHLFARPEYKGSKHPVELTDVRCLSADLALADGKWELRLQDQPQTTPGRGLTIAKSNSGWCTLLVKKDGDDWSIEAWRYTVNPPDTAPPPTLLSKPGYVGRGDD
jgi:creatinine amidohydrolase